MGLTFRDVARSASLGSFGRLGEAHDRIPFKRVPLLTGFPVRLGSRMVPGLT